MPPAEAYFLTSARLGFRLWRESDLPLALALWGDPRVTRHIDARGRLSEADVRERLAAEIACQEAHGIQYWPLFLRESGEHAGCSGLRPYGDERGVLEIGFHILARHWGKGLATESARAVMAHAFDELGAQSLFAGHNPRNAASRAVLLKLGFRHTHDEHYEPTGLQHPSYRMTAEEFQALRPR